MSGAGASQSSEETGAYQINVQHPQDLRLEGEKGEEGDEGDEASQRKVKSGLTGGTEPAGAQRRDSQVVQHSLPPGACTPAGNSSVGGKPRAEKQVWKTGKV